MRQISISVIVNVRVVASLEPAVVGERILCRRILYYPLEYGRTKYLKLPNFTGLGFFAVSLNNTYFGTRNARADG